MMPVAAFFDLDGTLIDREPLMQHAVHQVTDRAGLGFTEADLAPLVGRAWQDVYEVLDIERRASLTFVEFIDRVMGEAKRLVADGFETEVLAGGVALMERLHARSVPVWLVTGSLRHEADLAIEQLGIAPLLGGSLAAEDYTRGKPDPECYLAAAQRLALEPEDHCLCLVVEDSQPGVLAGIDAGMKVLATTAANRPVGHPSHQDVSAAHLVVSSLATVDDAALADLFS